MIYTREQLLANYKDFEIKGKSGVKIYDQDELLCTYKTTKGMTKAVFMVDTLDRNAFKSFCQTKNKLNADKVVVYCEQATYESPGTLEIILNRN